MQVQKVDAKQVITVTKGENKGLFVCNLGEQIAFSFVVPGNCGGLAVQPKLSQLEDIFSVYNIEEPISIYVTGGRNTSENIEYDKALREFFTNLQSKWIGPFDFQDCANLDIHYDGLTMVGTEIPDTLEV